MSSTGFAPQATSVDIQRNCVVYDVTGGSRLEADLGPRRPSYRITRSPGDYDGTDHRHVNDSWGPLDPADQRQVLDATLYSYVFAEAMSGAGHPSGDLGPGAATAEQPDGRADDRTVTVPVLATSDYAGHSVRITRGLYVDEVTVIDPDGTDPAGEPEKLEAALPKIVGTRAPAAQLQFAVAAAAERMHRIRRDDPAWDSLRP